MKHVLLSFWFDSVAMLVIQSGVAVALEIIADPRHGGGFDGLLGVVDGLRQQHGSGVFASSTPAEVGLHLMHLLPKILESAKRR